MIEFPVQSQWIAYWGDKDTAAMTRLARDMAQDGATGIIAHLQVEVPHLPPLAKMREFLAIWGDHGLTPYLSVWQNDLSSSEADRTVENWDKGEGRFAGLIVDVEAQWQQFATRNPIEARDNFDRWIARMRPLTPLLGYTSYASPGARPGFHFEWWDESFDLFLPQAYTGAWPDSDAEDTFERTLRSVRTARLTKPVITLRNAQGRRPAQTRRFAELALARHGAVSWWRYPFSDESRRVFQSVGTFPPDGEPPDGEPPELPPLSPPDDVEARLAEALEDLEDARRQLAERDIRIATSLLALTTPSDPHG